MGQSPSAPLTRLTSIVLIIVTIGGGFLPVAARQADVRCGESGATPSPPAAAPTVTAVEWTAGVAMPRPRSEFAAAVIDDWIFVAGGFGGLTLVDCFQPATGAWAVAADLPAGVHHPGVAALEGLLYVAGGYTDAGGATDRLWAYDPASDAWQERAPMPTARGALGLAAAGGKLYAIGGATGQLGGPVTGVTEIYDPVTDEWTAAVGMPTPREHLAVVAGEGRIFAVGGRANGDEGDALAGAAEAYDPAADRWEPLAPLPTPRGGVSGVFVAGQIVVLGGERGQDTYDDVEAYDIASGSWRALPPMPTPRHGLASAAIGDTIYAIAGSTRAGAIEHTPVTEILRLPSPG